MHVANLVATFSRFDRFVLVECLHSTESPILKDILANFKHDIRDFLNFVAVSKNLV